MSPFTPRALLDTDILSALMKGWPGVLERARVYLGVHRRLTFSIITRYEILRGLHAKDANKQLARFESLCRASLILPLTDGIIVQAARIYANLRRRGQIIGDADILIAATSLEHDLDIVTNNEGHFRRIEGVETKNWLS